MAYKVVMPYHLHMPSYFLETFTEYPYLQCFICVLFQAWHLSLFRQDEWRVELWNLKT